MTDHSDRPSLRESIDVLLVEDNPGDVRLTREAIAQMERETRLHVVTNGDDAVDFLMQRGEYESATVPDLVLLDLNLPGRDGREVLEIISDDRQLQHLPVIVLTSSADSEDVLECYGSHANAYLTKPTDPTEFISLGVELERFWFERAHLPPTPQ